MHFSEKYLGDKPEAITVIEAEKLKSEYASLIAKAERLRKDHESLELTKEGLESQLLEYRKKKEQKKEDRYARDYARIEADINSEIKKFRILLGLTPDQEKEIFAMAVKVCLSLYASEGYKATVNCNPSYLNSIKRKKIKKPPKPRSMKDG